MINTIAGIALVVGLVSGLASTGANNRAYIASCGHHHEEVRQYTARSRRWLVLATAAGIVFAVTLAVGHFAH